MNPCSQASIAETGSRRGTVSAGFVTGILSGLSARSVAVGPILAAVGISPDVLRDPDARVPLTAYAALYNHLVKLLDDEGFGLFAAKLRAGTFQFLCRSVMGSRDLEEALSRTAHFLRLVLPDFGLVIARDDVSARIEIRETAPDGGGRNDPRRVFAFEWLLRLVHGLACWFVGRSLQLDSVQFPYEPPPQSGDYTLIYTAHPAFTGDLLVARLQASLLALPIRREQEDLARFLEGAPGKITMLYRRDREMVRQIRDILAADLTAQPGLEEVADRLNLSLRTVQRRLEMEGSSFRAIKSALRRDVAMARLEKTRRPIADIAAELGYAEPSAFFRAFVDWTGEAPTRYRKRLRPPPN
jgi:AraC-like DNA-binding protein